MKRALTLFAFLTSTALLAQNSSISNAVINSEQGKMRSQFKESASIYSSLEKQIHPKYQAERNSFSVEEIKKQYENAIQQIRSLEGTVLVQKSVSGKSLIWGPRHRQADYELRQNAETFFSGPEDDVVLFSGEFIQSATDMSYPQRGDVGFLFRRHYSSQTDYKGSFGNGWDFNYNAHLVFDKESPDDSSEVSLHFNGLKFSFTKKGSDWQSGKGNFLHLKYESGMYCVYDSQLKRLEFEPSSETKTGWRLKAIASRHGQYSANRVSIHYQDNSDRIDYISEPYGNKISVCYDQAGRIVQIASTNKTVSYSYDNAGQLELVIYSDSAINLNEKASYKTKYGYSPVAGRNLLVSRRTNDSSSVYSVDYDSDGKVSKIGYKSNDLNAMWSFQRNNNVVTVTPAQPAAVVNYVFNSSSCKDLPSEIKISALNSTETFVYNPDGLIVEHLNSVGVKTVREYDSGNPLPELRANLLKETIYPSRQIDPDAAGKIITEKTYLSGTSFPESVLISENDKENVLSRQEYKYSKDNYDLIRLIEDGIQTRYNYNQYGEIATILDANNNATIIRYASSWPEGNSFAFSEGTVNGSGLMVSVIADVPKSILDKACSDLGASKYQYNDLSRVNPVSFQTQYAYNEQGNIIHLKAGTEEEFSIFNRKGDALATWTPKEGNTIISLSRQFLPNAICHQFTPGETQTYKGSSNRLFSGNYYVETINRDSLNQIVSVTKTDEKLNGMSVVYTYSRYPNGNIRTITDPTGITRVDEYGNNGLLHRQYLQNGNDSAELSKDIEYFSNGEIKKYVDAYGEEVVNGLDRYGRLTKTTNSLGINAVSLFDGAGRVIEERKEKDGKVISQKDYTYGKNGLLSTVYEHRISDGIDEKILTKTMVYDDNGNVVASRGVHEKSWEHFLYDGMNRAVVHKQASGDYSVAIYDNDQIGMTRQLDCVDNNNYRSEGVFVVCDKRGNPVVSIPVDIDNRPQFDKCIVSAFDVRGTVISIKQTNLNNVVKEYNSLGLLVSEKTIPLSKKYGEKDVSTLYSYLPNGNLFKKEIANDALAIYGDHDNAHAVIVHAPQTTTYTYDKLGREHSICQPDGLIVEKHYNEHSMPTAMVWKHVADQQIILRHLQLAFGKQGRLISISDAKTGNVLRSYQYDDYGNRVKETDGDVVISRQFDSMGGLLSEQTFVGQKQLPGFTVKYSLQDGTEALTWNNMPARSRENWNTQTVVRDPANRVEAMRLDQSTIDFAKWKYLGSLESERRIPESHITQRNTFNNCNELIKTSFLENSTLFGELNYLYDTFGNEIYSSTSLANSTYTYAQYMDYNSFQQIVAQNGEINLPSPDNALMRWKEVLGTTSIHSQKTSRMVYDQVDNIWANYRGHIVATPNPDHDLQKVFSSDNLSSFVSSAKTLSSSNPSSMDLLELASNRETTLASYSSGSKLTAEENEYDKLGNLIRFKGEFWNNNRSLDVVWQLSFDPMGRLVYMQALAESDTRILKKGQRAAELFFKYDADNRRIYKEVKDYSRTKTEPIISSEWTVYYGNTQSLVLKNDEKNSIIGQYLWKPDTRELLMAAIPQDIAENKASFATQRYYFQQDRGFNTVCITKAEGGKVSLVSAASYMCFGKNTTTAKIKSISSSMSSAKEDDIAYNNKLDESRPAIWKVQSTRPQFMTINLSGKSNLSSLNIWTDSSFPKVFLVFVLPPDVDAPRVTEDLSSYCEKMEKDGYLATPYSSNQFATVDKPVSLFLWNLLGDKIVLVWDGTAGNEIHINELEVGRIPDNPGAIAFAGQWLDRETNMYYQINRYRLAGSNKFISPDPIGFMDGNNLYAYAKNNPLSWHDPDGEFAHVLVVAGIGAIAGAAINSGIYAVQCWLTGEDFSWKELAIRAGTGALAGGIAAATFGFVNPALAGWGVNATANIVMSSASAGFTGGFASGAVDTLSHGGGLEDALKTGGLSGMWGAAGGAISGGVLSYTGASLGGVVLSGAAGGGAVGAVQSGWEAHKQTDDWSKVGLAALKGGLKGGALGAVVAGSAWGIGRATGRIQKLTGYPEDLPDPRKGGILIRTEPGERTYDGMEVKPGYPRHHIKPLALGGRDVKSNLEYVPASIHRQSHPSAQVKSAPKGTIFY